jgi:hypothetical protein
MAADFFCFLCFYLRSSHLVPAKPPLSRNVIFNRNKAAAERRRAEHKERHMEKEILKRDRNDDRIKCPKAGRPTSPLLKIHHYEPRTDVDWSGMFESPLSSLRQAIEVSSTRLKDRLGDQRGGSECEPIKILLQRENSAYAPNSQPRIPTRVCQGHVVTANLPTLGGNPKRFQSESETQRAKDLAAQL